MTKLVRSRSENEKIKHFVKEFNYYHDILRKFTNWIEDKNKTVLYYVSIIDNDNL